MKIINVTRISACYAGEILELGLLGSGILVNWSRRIIMLTQCLPCMLQCMLMKIAEMHVEGEYFMFPQKLTVVLNLRTMALLGHNMA